MWSMSSTSFFKILDWILLLPNYECWKAANLCFVKHLYHQLSQQQEQFINEIVVNPYMLEAPNFGIDKTLKLNKILPSYYFYLFIFLENCFWSLVLASKNLILKMNDFKFSIQDFVQGYPLQSWLSIVLRALGNEP